jgi:hypothetical protein
VNSIGLANAFAAAVGIEGKWEAARALMSQKGKPTEEQFYAALTAAFSGLAEIARLGAPIDRLVALDLLVRVPASMKNNKRVQNMARDIRHQVLDAAPPPLSLVVGKRDLPGNAEPAEIRENVAAALNDASGDWVFQYAIEAILEEERSQRCRLALAREIAAREPSIDRWLASLLKKRSSALRSSEQVEEAARIRDIIVALLDGIRSKRGQLEVSPESGQLLANLLGGAVSSAIPNFKRLEGLVLGALEFLDDILAVRLTLMDEPDLYQAIQVIHRWWFPRPFSVAIRKVARPIEDKLIAGIVFRARGGQRSEILLQRLKQLTNDDAAFQTKINGLVTSEPGLPDDTKDWLRGIERRPARSGSAAVLSSVSFESYLPQFGQLLRVSREVSVRPIAESERHLRNLVDSIASDLGLRLMNAPGDKVDFVPTMYTTLSGDPPKERTVEVVSAPIVRVRQDGTLDTILKGLVKDVR